MIHICLLKCWHLSIFVHQLQPKKSDIMSLPENIWLMNDSISDFIFHMYNNIYPCFIEWLAIFCDLPNCIFLWDWKLYHDQVWKQLFHITSYTLTKKYQPFIYNNYYPPTSMIRGDVVMQSVFLSTQYLEFPWGQSNSNFIQDFLAQSTCLGLLFTQ